MSINKLFVTLAVVLGLLLAVATPDHAAARQAKDMILVLDTSYSMSGSRGKNIIGQVKKSMVPFIDQMEKGDSITFVTFDTTVRQYPIIYIKGKKDKEDLKKTVATIEAKGLWTFTQEMVRSVLDVAARLEAKDKDRQRVIVVMTDALDDPPPSRMRDRFDIRKISTRDKDWFIFLVNLGEVKDPKLVRMQKQLMAVSKYTKVIDVPQPGKTLDTDLTKNVEGMEETKKQDRMTMLMYTLIPLALILLVFLFFLLKRTLTAKVAGKLDYWNHTLIEPTVKNFDLTKQNKGKITIGKVGGNTFTIKDLESMQPFVMDARKDKGRVVYEIIWGGGTVEFMKRAADGTISDGDVFKIANYMFCYRSS
jgi:hypothetical protein